MNPCLPPGGGQQHLDKKTLVTQKRTGSESGSMTKESLDPTAPVVTQKLKEKNKPAPWEPGYERVSGWEGTKTGNSGSGTSVSCRTIWHPSFCSLFEAQGHDNQSLAPPEVSSSQSEKDTERGCSALCSEDFFFSDPLLPTIARVPLGLSQSPEQILRKSRQLLAPPPIMSVWTQPAPAPAPILTWLCGPEITAVTSLLEISGGETESTATPKPSPAPPTP